MHSSTSRHYFGFFVCVFFSVFKRWGFLNFELPKMKPEIPIKKNFHVKFNRNWKKAKYSKIGGTDIFGEKDINTKVRFGAFF